MVEGDGGVHATHSREARPVTVLVTDETGRPLDAVALSFRLPEDGPSGAFSNGMKSEIATTGKDGRASCSAVRWNGVAGPFELRITAVRDDLRAGMVSPQYLSSEIKRAGRRGGGRGKWVVMAAAAGGAAAAAGLLGG
ncbi:MAG TPA: hypothetical protein VHN20_04750, partial [Beijerinckiaceae bacterium]|nr:hypothetical protein [Beijerinckiaceae bacterium]